MSHPLRCRLFQARQQCFSDVPEHVCGRTLRGLDDDRDAFVAHKCNRIEQRAIAAEANNKIYFIQISRGVEGGIFMGNMNRRIKQVKQILVYNRLDTLLGKFT